MGGGSRKSYATLYVGGVAHCIYLTEGGWSFWPPNIEILRNMFMVPYAAAINHGVITARGEVRLARLARREFSVARPTTSSQLLYPGSGKYAAPRVVQIFHFFYDDFRRSLCVVWRTCRRRRGTSHRRPKLARLGQSIVDTDRRRARLGELVELMRMAWHG